MNDQKQLWNDLHAKDAHHYSGKATDFAEEVIKIIKPHLNILELGCGVGNDSIAFANAGHNVIATDFSEVVINKNSEQFKDNPNLTFEVMDLSQPFKFKDDEFDVVYSRLSLHYFTDEITKKIFNEIHRVLKPGGHLSFICKSTDDPLFGQGEKIEENLFEFHGHIRHFFSEEYVKTCLDNNFTIEKLEKGEDNFYDRKSAYIKVIALTIK